MMKSCKWPIARITRGEKPFPRGGGTSCNIMYGKAPPEKGLLTCIFTCIPEKCSLHHTNCTDYLWKKNDFHPRGFSLWWPIRGGSPERGKFFRLQVYEREGILLVEVYKTVGKSVIWVCERAQTADRWISWLYKVEKTFCFCVWFIKWQCIHSS